MSRALIAVSALAGICISIGPRIAAQSTKEDSASSSYIGFDRNLYPGDDALPILRRTFSYSGYWISPPPGEKINTWTGKRQLLQSQGFGFLVLYRGRESRELKNSAQAAQKSAQDAQDAIASAQREGFAQGTIIFLDIEEGGRLPAPYHAYLRAWVTAITKAGYRPGVYCSAIPASEGKGVTILTSDDIRNNIGKQDLVYWVYNDVCPPAPGCSTKNNPPHVKSSGVSYASVWQFVQSPRRKEYTKRCASTYNADGNCYAPADTSHQWFLDLNSATTPDPSAPTK